MLLSQAATCLEVQNALDANDEELRSDVEAKLTALRDAFEQRAYCEEVETDLTYVVQSDAFINKVLSSSPYDLSIVPPEELKTDLVRVFDGRYRIFTVFSYKRTPKNDFVFPFNSYMVCHFEVPEDPFFAGIDCVPSGIAHAFFRNLGDKFTWLEDTGRLSYNQAVTLSDNTYFIVSEKEKFDEWCRDMFSEAVAKELERDPGKGIGRFYASLPPDLAEELVAAKLPQEDLLNLALSFRAGTGDVQEVKDQIKEYLEALSESAVGERKVIQTWTQQDLVNMGIRKGTLFEEAPWTLIKLLTNDLRAEGTRMQHCVGDKNMGYVRAVREGAIEIWSLRSRNGKPRFTLEVDRSFYETGGRDAPKERAGAIKQLKGKQNRLAGFTDKAKSSFKFPEEVVFWVNFFLSAGVDPYNVSDLTESLNTALSRPSLQSNPRSAGFDAPYQPLHTSRSRPYRFY